MKRKRVLKDERWFEASVVAAALVAGLVLARLPVLPLFAGLAGGVVLLAILGEPLVGLGLALIAAPFAAVERLELGLPLDSSQALLMLTLGAWLLRGLARRRVCLPVAPLLFPLLVFTGVAALSLWDTFSVGEGFKELLKWIEVIAIYLFVVEAVDREKLPWAIGMVLLAALVQAGIGVWQFGLRGYGPEHFLIPGTSFYRAYGTFEQPNPFAGYLGLNLPLAIGLLISAPSAALRTSFGSFGCAQDKFRILRLRSGQVLDFKPLTYHVSRFTFYLLLCALLLGVALVASWSRGAWLGAAAAMAVIGAFWPHRWWLGVGVVLIVAVLVLGSSAAGLLPASLRARLTDFTQYTQVYDVRGVGVNDANYSVIERLAHWQAAREIIRQHLWTGVGFGNYEVTYEGYRLLNWPHPLGHAHNYFLNITAETGLPGLLAYVFLWGAIFWHTFNVLGKTSGWQRGLALGALGVWVHLHTHNMFDNLYVSNLWIHLAVLLGLLTVSGERRTTNDEGPRTKDKK